MELANIIQNLEEIKRLVGMTDQGGFKRNAYTITCDEVAKLLGEKMDSK